VPFHTVVPSINSRIASSTAVFLGPHHGRLRRAFLCAGSRNSVARSRLGA
jgi:hypothetical protein